jgi:signal transduction histidine kinase
VTRFALTSLIVFAVVGVAITAFRTRDVRRREEGAADSRAALVADAVIAPVLTPGMLSAPMTGADRRTVGDVVSLAKAGDTGIERVKIWSTDGTVLFSDAPGEIGGSPPTGSDLREALAGGSPQGDISDLTASENVGERSLASKLFETYVPVRLTSGGRVAAVVEVYRDYGVIQAEIDRLTGTLSISLGAGLLALFVLLLPVMIGATRTLRRQNEQLTDQAAQLEAHLAREQATVAELIEVDKVKDDFVAAASHELRSPLTSILGYAGILRRAEAPDDPVVPEALEAIERQASRMLRLVMNLLRESRIEAGVLGAIETFDVASLVSEIAADFHDGGRRIRSEVPDGLESRCDRSKLADVLTNLVDNALKYAFPDTPVTIGARIADGTLTMWVRDRGEGIASADVGRIFDRFYQADQSSTRAHGGVGLGLHIVRELTSAMGGQVWVGSTPGLGSTFTVEVPMVAEPARIRREPQSLPV